MATGRLRVFIRYLDWVYRGLPELLMRTRPITLAILLACLASPVFGQGAEPAEIAKIRADIQRECEGKITFGPGFQTEEDVNGDGRPDYFLDYGKTECVGSRFASNAFCGSAGCVLDILVSGPKGYRNAWGDNVRGWSLERTGKKPVLAIDAHGSACGKSGAEPCRRRFAWNGQRFAPIGRR